MLDPVLDRGGPAQPMLIAAGLKKHFPLAGGGAVRAVDGVSFSVAKGETLGVVGESGCGKSTLARLLLHLIVPDGGRAGVRRRGGRGDGGIELRRLRRQAQMVFQDSASSLNPRMPVRDSVAFGPRVLGRSRRSGGRGATRACAGSGWTRRSSGRAIRTSCRAARSSG